MFINLQAGIDRRVLITAVEINGKFQINGVSHDICKTQNVDGSTLYDDFEVSINSVDQTSL